MVHVVSVHSFRGGTGKSNLTANLAVLLARRDTRVGVIDTDIQSPGIHVLFGLDGERMGATLNDWLFDRRPIAEVATQVETGPASAPVHLIPSSVEAGEITHVLRNGYDPQRLVSGLRDLVEALSLDVLLIDTHPGLGEETLLALAISDTVLTVLRPDEQDYEGTGVLLDVAAGLDVGRQALVVNKVPSNLDPDLVRSEVAETYGVPVVGILAHDDDMMFLASSGVFVQVHPDHPLTRAFGEVVDYLAADGIPAATEPPATGPSAAAARDDRQRQDES